MRISKTLFMQWEFCPRAFKYAYIDKLPYRQTVPMAMGARFHDVARDFFELLEYNDLVGMETLKDVKRVFYNTTQQIEVPIALEAYIGNFLEFEAQRYLELAEEFDDPIYYYKPRLLETKLDVPDAIDSVNLVGIIDRGDLTSIETLALVEYKLTPTINEKRVERELLFYTLLVEKAIEILNVDLPPVTHLIGYSPVMNNLMIKDVNKRKKINLQKRILKMAEETEAMRFPCKESPFCATCLGADICLNSIVSREEILELITGAAYSDQEVSMALEVGRSTVRGILSDMEMEGLVKRAFKGKTSYWWAESE